MYKYTIFIGMNSNVTHKEELNREEFIEIVISEFNKYNLDLNIVDSIGTYKGEQENSLNITVFDDCEIETIIDIVKVLKKKLSQDEIIINQEICPKAFFI